VYGYGVKEIEFYLYDKWGNLIFETKKWYSDKNMSEGWDGIYDGEILHMQTCGYYLKQPIIRDILLKKTVL
jgi:hypothetical protein